MILGYSDKTVSGRVARALRLVADALEGEGYHVIMMPLPTEPQFKAYTLNGGKNIAKINDARTEAGLWKVSPETNVKVLNKTWTGLYSGTGAWFRVAHRLSIHAPEFVGEELVKIISDSLPDGHGAEVLTNENYSVVYLHELTQLP